MNDIQTGIVTQYDEDEGQGTILRDAGGEIYFHYSAILCEESDCSLEEGNKVKFRVVKGPEGFQAQDVIVLDHDS